MALIFRKSADKADSPLDRQGIRLKLPKTFSNNEIRIK